MSWATQEPACGSGPARRPGLPRPENWRAPAAPTSAPGGCLPRGPERGSSQLLLGDLLNCGLKEGMTFLVLDTTGQVTGSGEHLPHSLPGLKVPPRERSPSSCAHCVDSTPGAEGGMELGARSGVPQTPGLGASCAVREAALWALGAGVWPEAPVGTLGGFTEEGKGPWGVRGHLLGVVPKGSLGWCAASGKALENRGGMAAVREPGPGWGVLQRRNRTPRTGVGWPEEEEHKEYRRVHLMGRFQPHRALWSRSRGAGEPQTGCEDPDLASGCYSHPSVPFYDFADQTFLAGAPRAGLWGQRRGCQEGWCQWADLPEQAPPPPASPPFLSTPGEGGRPVYSEGGGGSLGTRSLGIAAPAQPCRECGREG